MKNSTVLVNVEEVLDDIIVVSYTCSRGVFQGALINSVKKILPCGINLPQKGMSPKTDLDEDKLFSVSQRFTYFQDKLFKAVPTVMKSKKSKLVGRNNMTVRLRPRQVLCSKCKGICNENSENVDHSKKAETGERRLSHPGEKSPRPLFSENQQDNQPKSMVLTLPVETKPARCSSIVPPRVTRLRFCNSEKRESINPRKHWLRPATSSPSPPSLSSANEIPIVPPSASPKTELCPSVYEMDVNEGEAAGDSEASIPTEEAEPSTPDPLEDEKMVLRKKRSVGSMEDLWDETVFEESQKKGLRTTPVIKISFGSQGEGTVVKIPSKVQMYNPSESEAEEKAARKALKKAKKEARRKLSMSPSLPAEEVYRKHRRKEKHKKKHKADVTTWPKLSINLKRLNEKEYNASHEEEREGEEEGLAGGDSCSSSSGSDEESSATLGVLPMSDARSLSQGDIVWGKVHGFPWWPGKVLSISDSGCSTDTTTEAHVSWFGSSTSSMMPCNQLCPFLDFFKLRFNKKKKSSSYKEAIRQATEAINKKDPSDVIALIN